jgi:hypothetical protein
MRPPITPDVASPNDDTIGDDEDDFAGIGGEEQKRKPSLKDRPGSADAFLDEFWTAGAGNLSRSRNASENTGSLGGDASIGDRYIGPLGDSTLLVRDHLEEYCKVQVFGGQGLPVPYMVLKDDDDAAAAAVPKKEEEKFIGLWEEEIIPCGGPARSRVGERPAPRRGFHGEVVKGEEVILNTDQTSRTRVSTR